jgi:hypothetical protein
MNEAELREILIEAWRESNEGSGRLWTDAVELLYRKYPENRDFSIVEGKIGVLNTLYDTELRYGNLKGGGEEGSAVRRLARWIVSTESELTPLLTEGSPRAFEVLASENPVTKTNGKNLWSFASKFAHFHNPDAYPIYDGRAYNSVCEIAKVRPFHRPISDLEDDLWYRAWIDDLIEVQKFIGAPSFREVDKPLYWWNGGQD